SNILFFVSPQLFSEHQKSSIFPYTTLFRSEKLFIWQVAVAESERGKGLASKMLHHILERDVCENVRYVEATVSPSNIPSRKLFNGLARNLDTNIEVFDCFTAEDFPEQGHEDELTHQIGPFKERKRLDQPR